LNQNFPKDSDLKKLSEKLRHRPFLYLSSLGDMLGRFQESILKVPLRFTALSLLVRRGGSLTPTELAKLMLRSKHSITNIIDGLENEGYIIRDRDDQDRRVVNIKITSDGLRHMQEKVYNENPIIKNMMSCLSEKETEQLLDYIKRLRKELIKAMTEVHPNS
jgi:DNA-binding MarR family transcriptional regulator